MGDDSDSRTAGVGQKRTRNNDSIGFNKRQRRGTQDDAISINDSSSDDEDAPSSESYQMAEPKNQFAKRKQKDSHDINNIDEVYTLDPKRKKKKSKKKPDEKLNKKPNKNERRRLATVFSTSDPELSDKTDLIVYPSQELMAMEMVKAPYIDHALRVAMIQYFAIHLREDLKAIGSLPSQMWSVMTQNVAGFAVFVLRFYNETARNLATQICNQVECSYGSDGQFYQLHATKLGEGRDETKTRLVDWVLCQPEIHFPSRDPLAKRDKASFLKAARKSLRESEDTSGNASAANSTARSINDDHDGSFELETGNQFSEHAQTMIDPVERNSSTSQHAVNTAKRRAPAVEGESMTGHSSSDSHPDAAVAGPPTMNYPGSDVCLAMLSPEERQLQVLYWNISNPDVLVRCPICSKQGHMTGSCPSRVCAHCDAVDDHFSTACPSQQRCTKCREKGHGAESCPSKLIRSSVDGFECDICAGDHLEQHCSWIWRTFDPAKMPVVKKLDSLHMVGCYWCGASSHWGDDCPDPYRKKATTTSNVFSAAFANLFTNTPLSAPPPLPPAPSNGFSIKGRARPLSATLSDDEEDPDDESAFYKNKRKNNPAPAPHRGAIHVNVGRQAYNEPYAPQRSGDSRDQGRGGRGGGQGYHHVPPPQQLGNSGQGYSGGRFAQKNHGAPATHPSDDWGAGRSQSGGGGRGGRGRGGRGGGGRGGGGRGGGGSRGRS